ncbi:MAG: DUF5009 domain-containing protein [Paludibacteraceae bacterium]|nr:DUF5009 domain-containing protein [Paludibacteraceae bacterium]
MANNRLLALDVLRGITIAGMITVNNPGSWAHIYAPLEHAEWNGCTPTDLVFPFFMFVMGVAMCISYRKYDYRLTAQTLGKLCYRLVMILLVAYSLSLISRLLRGIYADDFWAYMKGWLPNMRIMGVFPRLAWTSFFGGLLLLTFKPKNAPWVAAVLLAVYSVIIAVTNSFELTADSLLAKIDLAVLGDDHIYHLTNAAGEAIPLDPEGILSTIPCFAHVLIGAYAGYLIMTANSLWDKVNRLFILGSIILMSGFLLDYAFPINKKIWSASYALVTCGLASQLLALLIWIIDIRGHKRWSVFFESFGANPLFIYCLSALFVYVCGAIRFSVNDVNYNLWSFWYKGCMQPLFGDNLGSLVCALSLVLLMWVIAHPLYRKKIYIKI